MPYKDPLKERQRSIDRLPVVVCPVCGTHHKRIGHRMSIACANCYDMYRTLYNLVKAAEYRAKQKNLEFNLTLDWALKQQTICSKTGIQLTYTNNGKNYTDRKVSTASIDKIDPHKGYTIDNCEIVCWWYNVAKQQFNQQEVYHLCKQVVDTYEKKDAQNVQK